MKNVTSVTVDTSDKAVRKYASSFDSWGSFGDVIPFCDIGPISMPSDDTLTEDPLILAPWLSEENEPSNLILSRTLLAKPTVFALTPTLPVPCQLTTTNCIMNPNQHSLTSFNQDWQKMTEIVNDMKSLKHGCVSARAETFRKLGIIPRWQNLLSLLEDDRMPKKARANLFKHFRPKIRASPSEQRRVDKVKQSTAFLEAITKANSFSVCFNFFNFRCSYSYSFSSPLIPFRLEEICNQCLTPETHHI